MASNAKRLEVLKRHLEPVSMSRPPSPSPVTTHVLDTSRGQPGRHIAIKMFAYDSEHDEWKLISEGTTNEDGRCPSLLAGQQVKQGCYKIKFDTQPYFSRSGIECFYPYVEITFKIQDPSQHYHVPLLLSPFSYSTYRGS